MWKSVSPEASSVSNSPFAFRRPARSSAIVPAPPIVGMLWQTAQLVPLKAGPKPFFAGFHFEEVVQPQAELLELDRRDAGKRCAQRASRLRAQQSRREAGQCDAKDQVRFHKPPITRQSTSRA